MPKTNPKAPNKIDFPAPVSPVIIDNLSEKSIFSFSIKAKLFIESEASLFFYLFMVNFDNELHKLLRILINVCL